MAFNPFFGMTVADLEPALQAAREDLLAGKTISSSGVGETRKSERIDLAPLTRVQMILAALSKLDPVTYPPSMVSPDKQTRVSFRPEQSNPCQ